MKSLETLGAVHTHTHTHTHTGNSLVLNKEVNIAGHRLFFGVSQIFLWHFLRF